MQPRALIILACMLGVIVGARAAVAAAPTLVIMGHQFTAPALLARPDRIVLEVPHDVSYGHAMRYFAVPLANLLRGAATDRADTLEARASDGFVTQIPLTLIAAGEKGGSVAWLAVEDPAHRWPVLPDKAVSAGPFYIVWEHPERSGISGEQWPYEVASLALVESPLHRWPQLALPADLPPDSIARHGQQVFLVQCFPCHRLYGAGNGEMGPDLGRPMSATAYLTDAGLRAIIRDPRAVRTWPQQMMRGFDKAALPDADLDAVIAYLRAKAAKIR